MTTAVLFRYLDIDDARTISVRHIARAKDRVKPEMWDALERAASGEPHAQIAASLGVTLATLRCRLQRIRWMVKRIDRRYRSPDVEPAEERAETSESAEARIARELAEGKRCNHRMRYGVCSLLLPCWDHGGGT